MAKNNVYEFFDAFLEKSILANDSFITDNPGIFTIDNLDTCVSAFVDKPDTSKDNFDQKSKRQFSGKSEDVQLVFAHFIWLWGMPASDMTLPGKKGAVIRFIGDEYKEKIKIDFVNGGIGSAGQRHKIKKPFEISFLLLLFRDVKKNIEGKRITTIEALKEYIETLCKELNTKNEETTFTTDSQLKNVSNRVLAMHHILLHLCNPKKYEAIAALKHKRAIVETFNSLLNKDNSEELSADIDENILSIRKKLSLHRGDTFAAFRTLHTHIRRHTRTHTGSLAHESVIVQKEREKLGKGRSNQDELRRRRTRTETWPPGSDPCQGLHIVRSIVRTVYACSGCTAG